ncbi:MAG: 2OG-Fe(II) oxygenase [Candidatus Marinimicrobia bacterium]|nr:2OG-Fe(II) oxygenase [Candidatus Neomarinimicrobiota bacterium]|tara:strand:+ start:2862 stop:3698 length:837 start_codon:yes stop_codon:yes gene_type:complete
MNVQTVDYNSKTAPQQFTKSLKETGFAVLSNHPIKFNQIQKIYTEWELFFKSNSKNDYLYDKVKQDGYFPFLSENAKNSKHKDLKEFFHIYPWGCYPKSITESTQNLYNSLCNIAETLLSWVEKNTPKNITDKFSLSLSEMVHNSPRNLLRIIHYPPLKGNEAPEMVRAAAHGDINLITVLVAGTQPGLQVQDVNGNWHDVTCDPGTIAVNTGDMLQMASNGYFPSTIHRVINPSGKIDNQSRLSMPLFLHPHDNVKLSEKYSALEYLNERLQEIGLK